EAARSAILKIEETILFFFLLLSPCLGAFAGSTLKHDADSAYLKGDYQQAAGIYEKLLRKEKDAVLYYNLGNTYYRSGNIGKAILSYERSLRLNPDAETRFNLQFVSRKTIDQLPEPSELFFVTAYKSVRRSLTSDAWAVCAFCALVMALLLQLAYLFSPRLGVRRVAFFGAIVAMVIFLLALLFAWQQKRYVESNDEAIVMPVSIQAMRTPAADAATAFTLHEGTKVRILDRTMADWRQIRLSDGREAWLKTKQIEEI
ncbi:MAG: tetratricopeptide repeat protein, partial [Prevotella sp.]|nr:tetratricopeptide repeat protein [Prevotella sp.]